MSRGLQGWEDGRWVEVPRLQHLRRGSLSGPLYTSGPLAGVPPHANRGQTLGVRPQGAWKACPGCGSQPVGSGTWHPGCTQKWAQEQPPLDLPGEGSSSSKDRGTNALHRPWGRALSICVDVVGSRETSLSGLMAIWCTAAMRQAGEMFGKSISQERNFRGISTTCRVTETSEKEGGISLGKRTTGWTVQGWQTARHTVGRPQIFTVWFSLSRVSLRRHFFKKKEGI